MDAYSNKTIYVTLPTGSKVGRWNDSHARCKSLPEFCHLKQTLKTKSINQRAISSVLLPPRTKPEEPGIEPEEG